jgi:hypothetical protein
MGSVAVIAPAAAGYAVPVTGGTVMRDNEEVRRATRASLLTGSTLVRQLPLDGGCRRSSGPCACVRRTRVVDVRWALRAAEMPGAEIHVVPGAPHRVATYARCHEVVADFVARALTGGAPRGRPIDMSTHKG